MATNKKVRHEMNEKVASGFRKHCAKAGSIFFDLRRAALNRGRGRAVVIRMRQSQVKLLALVERIFTDTDGTMTADERRELRALRRDGGLQAWEVKAVFRRFVQRTWGDAVGDGTLDADERARLAAVAAELRLPLDCVPPDVALVLALSASVSAAP